MEWNRRTNLWSGFVTSVAAALAFSLAVGCHQRSADEYLSSGDQAMQQTQLAEAERNYQAAAKLAPNDPRVHVALGNLYVFEQKPDLAQTEFIRVLELDPMNAAAHSALGSIYESRSQPGSAEEQYRAAVVLKPADANYRLGLGAMLAKEGKMADAEAEMRTAIGLAPRDARTHLALANLLVKSPERKTEADAEFAEVRALDPHLLPSPPATSVTPAEAAAAPSPAAPGAAAAKQAKLKPLNRRFKLTKDSAVYQVADSSATVIGQVHRGRWIHVTGIQGSYLQITLRNGTVGFVPVAAAE